MFNRIFVTFIILNHGKDVFGLRNPYNPECGPHGFVCEGLSKVRLCEGDKLIGPSFFCPANTVCNEESTDLCENVINNIDSSITRNIQCHRSERIADPTVPGCKGYVLCIPNKNRFQGIKFKCSGKTIFNGYTRACTSPEKYKCPLVATNKTKPLYYEDNGKINSNRVNSFQTSKDPGHRSIYCKNYKFTVTEDNSPSRVTYFCPSKPTRGESVIYCTVFSNNFCLTLERDTEDQFMQSTGTAFRRPRESFPKS
ncbi:unnamed protein product [Euphydryas editha]|uniref:Chitin-binding type-2 domain-containing protein n=1 Tax=Euphydryas editha TaxID=104508 RepID=A0AAU9U339_EUPED|nr:unnamed protein product [Euphydryas editha]